ncbi:hypothetical protein ABFV51_15535 [Pseudomonas asgharzadehiana]|uniref:XAC2610-related protein n=1 Tax=Pseudomonas TaxID=286 RepID=UPI0008120D72|nr:MULTISPECIES: hypothetical protein [unclassified Pseudomonas]CRM43887.1 hypothetical protein [Pseudomonas sp. 31 E 5]CRM60959.1 hypothetical protein [Pseudomonas sp. 31 E 6]
MRSLVSGVLLSLSLATSAIAEPRSFSVNDPSGQFLVEVLFPQVPQDLRERARALVTVRDNATLQILQQLETPAGNVPLDNDGKTDAAHLVGESGLLYFADINGDGRQDLAIRHDTGAAKDFQYSYDVYLQDPHNTRWVLNGPLSTLANETSGGMFSVNPKDGIIHSQTDRGCCWMRVSRWQMRDGELVQLSSYTQQEVPATDDDANNSMPSGYMLRTTGEWKDGQWLETPRLEGPVNEDAQRLVGTLDGKIAVQIWYQQQGAVVIGELRYTNSGSGKPIKLVGDRGEYGDDTYLYLHEYTDDGHQTGIWRIKSDYTGTWVSGAKGDKRERVIQLHDEYREPDYELFGDVARDQRDGHYQMRDDFLDRDGDLDLRILPERDAQGREVAEFTVTLKETGTGKVIVSAHHTVPMETENLIIVREPLAARRAGPYHIQLVKHFAVINHNSAPDFPDYFTGMYRKQP